MLGGGLQEGGERKYSRLKLHLNDAATATFGFNRSLGQFASQTDLLYFFSAWLICPANLFRHFLKRGGRRKGEGQAYDTVSG